MFDDVTCGANNDRWNAILFQVTRNQTQGLVADRSDRRQDRYIDPISLTNFKRSRRRSLQHQLLTIAAIYVVELACDRTNTSGLDKFLQSGERKIGI